MPQELRIIMFSDEEVAQAIVLYLRRQGISSAQGRVTVLRKVHRPQLGVDYAIGIGPDSETHALGSESLAGALVLFCIEKGIPLPRMAQKILHVMEDRIVLVLDQGFPAPSVRKLFLP